MRIGVDIRALTRGSRSGIEEYTINLLAHLIPLAQDHKFLLFYNAFRKERLDFPWVKYGNVELKESSVPNKLIEYSTFLFKWPLVDRLMGGADVFLSPHFTPLALSRGVKEILVFHDLSFIYYPEFFPPRKNWWHFISSPKKRAGSADKVIAVSESTKNDLVKFYDIPREKISVIYEAVDEKFRPMDRSGADVERTKKKYGLPEKFVLFLGTIEPRKNIEAVIGAYQKMISADPKITHSLVIAGPKGWLFKEITDMADHSSGGGKIIFTGPVVDGERAHLYNLADIFVYPSFFEGFGLPPLEAMSCGVPTIVSDISSLPEVVKDAAIAVDPYDPDSLAFFMKELILNKGLREHFSRKALERAAEFSWERTAQKTLEEIEKL